MNSGIRKNLRSGAALLAVLFIIMVITILSLGFLSQSDVELSSGRNMELRSRMDYLAESGLEQAKGLILNPQDVQTEYYTGASGLQLESGSSDYYNISVIYDNSDPTDQCNYIIDCNAYELKNGQHVGQSNLNAKLRLDPCIALWAGDNLTLSSSEIIYGDIYCRGALINYGLIDGDVFAASFLGNKSGRKYETSELSLNWPAISVNNFRGKPGVTYQYGNYTLNGNISGMLLVDGDLTIQPDSNVNIIAAKNLPALYVTGDLIIGKNASVRIEGLAAAEKRVFINGSSSLNVLGGLFAGGSLLETDSDSSGNNNYAVLYNGSERTAGYFNRAVKFDGTDDKVENYSCPNIINNLSAVTISLWVKSEVTNQDRDIMFTREPTDSDDELGIRYDRDGAYGGGTNAIKASIRTSTGYTQIESTSGVQTADWQHLALTWQDDIYDSHLKLYINGVYNTPRYDSGPVRGTIAGIRKLMLGCGSKNTFWKGVIDDVRVYNRALSVSEINEVKAGASLSGLILYWNFDEDNGTVNITASPAKTAVNIFTGDGQVSKWGQAAGAFYRSIERK